MKRKWKLEKTTHDWLWALKTENKKGLQRSPSSISLCAFYAVCEAWLKKWKSSSGSNEWSHPCFPAYNWYGSGNPRESSSSFLLLFWMDISFVAKKRKEGRWQFRNWDSFASKYENTAMRKLFRGAEALVSQGQRNSPSWTGIDLANLENKPWNSDDKKGKSIIEVNLGKRVAFSN